MNTIIVFKEKYGDRYFDASTSEKKVEAFHTILKGRWNDGYWYNEPKVEDFSLGEKTKNLST